MNRTPLPQRRRNETREVVFDERPYSVCVGYYDDGRPGEVFADGPKEGSFLRHAISDACVLISIALQHGVTTDELGHSLGRVPRWVNGAEGEGPASIVGAILETLTPIEPMPGVAE